jgi:hypothetical protein
MAYGNQSHTQSALREKSQIVEYTMLLPHLQLPWHCQPLSTRTKCKELIRTHVDSFASVSSTL